MQNIGQAIAAAMNGQSQVADRHPELPPNGQYDITVQDFRANVHREAGLQFFVDTLVNQSGGVAIPAGTVCTAKIQGFNSANAVAFAIRDLRGFVRAALTKVDMRAAQALFADATDIASWNGLGVPTGWIGDDARWTQLVNACVEKKPFLGQRLFVKSESKTGKAGKAKTIYQWFPAA